MLLTESPWKASATTALEPAAYALRLHGGTEHEQSIPIPLGKHSIGSGPRCSLRLQFPGVVPMQCLIAYNGESLRVRSWAENTFLNGEAFEEAELTAGDVLTLGPVDLEVIQPLEAAEPLEIVEPFDADDAIGDATELEQPETDSVAAKVVVAEPFAEPVVTSPILATPADVVNEDVSAYPSHSYVSHSLHPANMEPTKLEEASDYLPVASEKSLSDAEEQFEQVDRAIDALSTIDELGQEAVEGYAEGSLEASVEEPTVLDEPLLLAGPKAVWAEPVVDRTVDETTFDAEVTNDALETVFRELQAGNAIARGRSRRLVAALRQERDQFDVLAERVSALEVWLERPASVESPPVSTEEIAATPEAVVDERSTVIADTSVADATAFEAELAAVRDQLAVRENELAHARYSIDALERQLIDSQHTFNAFVEERTLWEEQFSQLEMQLSQYVARVQELEQQLEEVRAAQTATEEALAPAEERATEAKLAIAAPVAVMPVATEPVELETVELTSFPTTANVTDVAEEPLVEEAAVAETIVEEPKMAEVGSRSIIDQLAEELTAVAPESQESHEIVDEVSTHVAADEPEVDAALEHLRDLAILRQDVDESTVAMDDEAVAEPTAAKEPVEAKPKSQPTSFLERYSHMFQEDTTPPEPPPRPAPVVAEPVAAGEDEESVEQYMANLLGRMRGTASTESSTVATRHIAQPQTQPEEKPVEAHVELMQSLDEMHAKPVSPEYASDMVAMRALANESARHAIGVHTARTLRRKAKTRAVVSLLGAAVGFYLLLLAPSWKSLQFVAGCAASITALYWGRLTLISLIKGIQVGAFHDIDEIADPAEVLHPKLPIDVEPKVED